MGVSGTTTAPWDHAPVCPHLSPQPIGNHMVNALPHSTLQYSCGARGGLGPIARLPHKPKMEGLTLAYKRSTLTTARMVSNDCGDTRSRRIQTRRSRLGAHDDEAKHLENSGKSRNCYSVVLLQSATLKFISSVKSAGIAVRLLSYLGAGRS